jgi:hypothetical protein
MHHSQAHVALSLILSEAALASIPLTIVSLLDALSSINAKTCSNNQYFINYNEIIAVPVFQAHIALMFPIQPLPYFHPNALQ